MMYGETMGTSTLAHLLVTLAQSIHDRRDNGESSDGEMLEEARDLMEGAMVLWAAVMAEAMDEQEAQWRTLARTMAYCMYDGKECDDCAMNDADMRVRLDPYAMCDGLQEELTKMGVIDE